MSWEMSIIIYAEICSAFNGERKEYLGRRKFRSLNVFDVKKTMNTQNTKQLKKLTKCINVILNKFK